MDSTYGTITVNMYPSTTQCHTCKHTCMMHEHVSMPHIHIIVYMPHIHIIVYMPHIHIIVYMPHIHIIVYMHANNTSVLYAIDMHKHDLLYIHNYNM